MECPSEDERINQLLKPLHDDPTATRVHCERSLNATLGGSCQTPIAAYATLQQDNIHLQALVALPDGSKVIRAEATDRIENARALGRRVGETLRSRGADEIIAALAVS